MLVEDLVPDGRVRAVCIAHDVPEAFASPAHTHRQAQLIHASEGIVSVATAAATWIVPPNRAVWVPAGVEHATSSRGPVRFRALFVTAASVPPAFPGQCRAVEMSPLVRELMLRCAALPPRYAPDGHEDRLVQVLLDELRFLADQRLQLPRPSDRRLARLCDQVLADPGRHVEIDAAARLLAMSRRSFLRLARRDLGMTFGQWQQQARLLASLPMLAAGTPILRVALELGYDSPSAFTALFRRAFGTAPTRYFAAPP